MTLGFFFNDTATTEIYTLSLHDALPISVVTNRRPRKVPTIARPPTSRGKRAATSPRKIQSNSTNRIGNASISALDRKSTRLNSSHANISYAVFCLKKKKILLHHPFSYNT